MKKKMFSSKLLLPWLSFAELSGEAPSLPIL